MPKANNQREQQRGLASLMGAGFCCSGRVVPHLLGLRLCPLLHFCPPSSIIAWEDEGNTESTPSANLGQKLSLSFTDSENCFHFWRFVMSTSGWVCAFVRASLCVHACVHMCVCVCLLCECSSFCSGSIKHIFGNNEELSVRHFFRL